MIVEVEVPDELVRGLEAYSKFRGWTLRKTVRQVLADFLFGILEDGFNPSEPPGGTRSATR